MTDRRFQRSRRDIRPTTAVWNSTFGVSERQRQLADDGLEVPTTRAPPRLSDHAMRLIEEHPGDVGHLLKEPRVRRLEPVDPLPRRVAVVGGTLSLYVRQAVVSPGAEQTHAQDDR
jgi:hypothetical protein